jgi:hypothetical protein
MIWKSLISSLIMLVGVVAITDVVTLFVFPESRFFLLPPNGTAWGKYVIYLGLLNVPVAIVWRSRNKGCRHAFVAFWIAVVGAAFAVIGWFLTALFEALRQL